MSPMKNEKIKKWKNEKMMVGMQGIGWCDMGMGFLCVSGCYAVWVEIGAKCVARESGVGWRIFANFEGIVATPLAFRAEMLASRGSLCVTLHHRNATAPSDPASLSTPAKPIKPCKAIIGTPQPHQTCIIMHQNTIWCTGFATAQISS